MKKVLMLAVAAMAFAIPATASAADFTHNGTAIEHGKSVSVSFTGPAAFSLTAAPANGVHCPQIHASLKIEATGTGTVTTFTGTECTNTPQSLTVDTIALGLPWTVHAIPALNKIQITGVHINNKVTLGGNVVGESTLQGSITAIVNNSEAITTATLDDEGATVEIEGTKFQMDVTGDISPQGSTQIGLE